HQWQQAYQEKKQLLHYEQQQKNAQLQELNRYQHKAEQLQQQHQQLQNQYIAKEAKLQQTQVWQQRYDELYQEYQSIQARNSRLQAELRETATLLQENRKAAEEKVNLLQNSEQRLTQQFEVLANRI